MKGQDITTLFFTFWVGFAAGVYLYFSGFAPQFLSGGGFTREAYDSLTIVSEEYGVCERTDSCRAFQVIGSGSYSYLEGITGAPITGTLPRSLRRQVFTSLRAVDLAAAAEPGAATTCNAFTDGIDIRYTITFDSQVYNLDTCRTRLLLVPEVADTLASLWDYFLMYR